MKIIEETYGIVSESFQISFEEWDTFCRNNTILGPYKAKNYVSFNRNGDMDLYERSELVSDTIKRIDSAIYDNMSYILNELNAKNNLRHFLYGLNLI